MRTQTGTDALWLYRLSAGSGDELGNATAHHFAVAETLWHARESVPSEWEFHHGVGGRDDLACVTDQWPDAEYWNDYQTGTMTADDLRYVGNVMMRYAMVLKQAGLDY